MSTATAVEVHRDLGYAATAEQELSLDLYLPADRREPCPIVLYLHGGGFMVGAKDNNAEERLVPVARAGIGVASASYRFTDVAHYPAQVHDVKAAVRWLRAHAAEYGYRGDRVGAWGASAGGYLALMLGLTAGSPPHEGDLGEHTDQSSAVDATCAWFTPADLLQPPPSGRSVPPFIIGPWPPPGPSPPARLLGLGDVADDPDAVAAISPINHAAGARGAFLLMHGDADALVAEDQSLRMHEALVAAGADSTVLLLPGANHEDPRFHSPAALGAVTGFFTAGLSGAER
jgi:acetyl esterase/lipase